MREDEKAGHATVRVFAIAAIALLGLAFSAIPIAERLDAAALDTQWSLLRKLAPRPAPDDIIIVGLDEGSLRGLKDPMALWQEPLAKALARIAAAKPRAIGLALPLPDRSFESVRPGLDLMLATSLAAARRSGPFVAVIDIDARTRAARPIYPPYLAVLNDERLSLSMLARDNDGLTRRFSLLVPTEDGGFPTFAGRLCRALSKNCSDGLIDYGLGTVHRFVPLHQVVESADPLFIERLFRDRIVLIGETQRFSDRVDVPVNLAGWEPGGRTSPSVVVHAQALRTALLGAPIEAARPFTLLLVTAAALLFLVRRPWLALLAGLLAAAGVALLATWLLRSGLHLPVAAAMLTLGMACGARAAVEAQKRHAERVRLRDTFSGRVGPATMKDILGRRIAITGAAQRLELAVLAICIRMPASPSPSPRETARILGRLHAQIASAVHRHDGFLETVGAQLVVAVFGAPRRTENPCGPAAAALKDLLGSPERPDVVAAAAFGEAVAGPLAPRGPLAYAVAGAAVHQALALCAEARERGETFAATDAFRACAGDALSDFQHPGCD